MEQEFKAFGENEEAPIAGEIEATSSFSHLARNAIGRNCYCLTLQATKSGPLHDTMLGDSFLEEMGD